MENTSNLFYGARKAVGMTIGEIASKANISDRAYSSHENEENGMFRLQELKPLYQAADDCGKGLVMNAIEQFFLAE